MSHSLPSSHSSLPRNTRISVPPKLASGTSSPYGPQPIISRISIPPASSGVRKQKPIPLSVIMRLQNPNYTAAVTGYAPGPMGELQQEILNQYLPLPREYLRQNQTPQPQQPQRQPPYYREGTFTQKPWVGRQTLAYESMTWHTFFWSASINVFKNILKCSSYIQWLETTCHENAFIFRNKIHFDFLMGHIKNSLKESSNELFKLNIM